MTLTVLVLVWTVSGGFAGLIAQGKGRSAGPWTLAGLLLGPIGLLWAAWAGTADERDAEYRAETARRLAEHRKS